MSDITAKIKESGNTVEGVIQSGIGSVTEGSKSFFGSATEKANELFGSIFKSKTAEEIEVEAAKATAEAAAAAAGTAAVAVGGSRRRHRGHRRSQNLFNGLMNMFGLKTKKRRHRGGSSLTGANFPSAANSQGNNIYNLAKFNPSQPMTGGCFQHKTPHLNPAPYDSKMAGGRRRRRTRRHSKRRRHSRR
jgi:hypothetical protein